MTLKDALPILNEIAAGKPGQYLASGAWNDSLPTTDWLFYAMHSDIRLKPKPEKWAREKAAFAEGKKIQWGYADNDIWSTAPATTPRWDEPRFKFRIAPEPEWLPLTADDVPPGSAVRKRAGRDYAWDLIHSVGDAGALIIAKSNLSSYLILSWTKLFRDYEILRPGKTWELCRKEATP